MTVYVDNMLMEADVPNGHKIVRARWSHMVADTREELDSMARRLGLKLIWRQSSGTWKEHYDVTETKRAAALDLGAIELHIGPDWKAFMDAKKHATAAGVAKYFSSGTDELRLRESGAGPRNIPFSKHPVLELFESHEA